MPFTYQSGEEIRLGDRVILDGHPGEIEFIADPVTDPENWFVTEHGGGVMIQEPKVFGSLFLSAPHEQEDLIFVSRRE